MRKCLLFAEHLELATSVLWSCYIIKLEKVEKRDKLLEPCVFKKKKYLVFLTVTIQIGVFDGMSSFKLLWKLKIFQRFWIILM